MVHCFALDPAFNKCTGPWLLKHWKAIFKLRETMKRKEKQNPVPARLVLEKIRLDFLPKNRITKATKGTQAAKAKAKAKTKSRR